MQMELAALGLAFAIIFLIVWIIGSFFLWLGLKLVDTPEEKMGFGSIMITALINAILSAILLIIGWIISWWVIKVRHTDSWGKAIAAWILSIAIPMLIAFGIMLGLGMTLPFLMGPVP